jgi:ATP-dependent Clp endopeptidase proteolytic subunit ClpP
MKTIRLDGVVGAHIFADELAREIDGEKEINLIINSGGGDVLEGFAIYNLLDKFEGRITAEIDLAASMASVIAMAADEITMMSDSSIMMIHRPWGIAGGNSEDFRKQADTLDKMEDMLLNIYASRSGLDRGQLSQMLEDETWLNADEALEFGLTDKVSRSQKADFAMVAMSCMKAQDKVDFSTSKFLAKIESMKANKKPIKNLFDSCKTLADVETVMRNEIKISRAEALAISAAVKRVLGDQEPKHEEAKDIKSIFENFHI